MGWEEVDEGWGSRAKDWAYLMEPAWWPEFDQVLRDAGVGAGTRYLDVCCGSGFAAQMAGRRGAEVHGLDASDRLLAIAEARTAEGDFRHGDMHDLPWKDGTFDVVTSFRGIWGSNDQAVVEAARVLEPGGTFAVTFFPIDEPGEEGRVEEMCEATGLVPGERRFVRFDVEMGPEVEDLLRASTSPGATYIAVKERGLDSGVTIYTLSEMAPPG